MMLVQLNNILHGDLIDNGAAIDPSFNEAPPLDTSK